MKEIQRLTKQEKIELLSMFSSDRDAYLLAKTMCLKYLEIYPSEKKFKTHVYNQIKDYKYGNSINKTRYFKTLQDLNLEPEDNGKGEI